MTQTQHIYFNMVLLIATAVSLAINAFIMFAFFGVILIISCANYQINNN